MVVVGGVAADDRAEADDGGVLLRAGQALGDERDLERPGHPREVDVALRDSVTFQPVQGAGDETFDDERVEPRRHQGESPRRRRE
jgi:hypothetical protein